MAQAHLAAADEAGKPPRLEVHDSAGSSTDGANGLPVYDAPEDGPAQRSPPSRLRLFARLLLVRTNELMKGRFSAHAHRRSRFSCLRCLLLPYR